jgi:DegV family protein with EDD domain
MTIRVVTDSTCDIPSETAAAYGITVVPAYVNVGERSYLDGVEISRHEFYQGLPNYPVQPTTAAPAPGAFVEVYKRLAKEGATGVLSIHVASSLSGILNAARIGAQAADVPKVTLVDSQQLSMGLGLLAIRAAEAAASGQSMTEIVMMLEKLVDHTYVFGLLDTLEYLRRSGRVNWAMFGVGTLLRIKPLVKVYMGQVEVVERVRTSKRALRQFLKIVADLGVLESIALLHIQANDRIEFFRQQTQCFFPKDYDPLTVEVTPALGAHIGPGGLGIACIVAE